MLSPTQAILIFAAALTVPDMAGSMAQPHSDSDNAVDNTFFHVERISVFSPFGGKLLLFSAFSIAPCPPK